MKILIVPIILLIAASIASAQVSLSASVQADVDSIIAIAKVRLAASINAGNSAIQGVTSAYTRATGTARNLIVTILNRLGSRGQEAATRVSSDINNAVNSTTTQINNQLTQLQQYLNNSVQYVNNALQSDTDKLKAAINANSSAIKCWLDNRDKIRALVKSAGAQSVSIVTAGGAALSSQNLKLVATASKAVQRIEADVLLKCGSSRTCAETYVSEFFFDFQQ